MTEILARTIGDVASLHSLLMPQSMAIVGASDRPGSVGHLALTAARATFPGPTFAVHPHKTSLLGEPAFRSVRDLPEVPDLVVVSVPADVTLTVARECVDLGVGGLLVFSSGFAETGEAGARLQAVLAETVRGSATRLLGPNSLGFFDAARGSLATFLFAAASRPPRPGPLALVSQSGGFAEQLVARVEEAGVGMTWMLSTGNELDVTLTDGFEFLLERDEAEIVVLFAESIKHPTRFMAAARRARELARPVIILKTGRSAAGARAAITHTASMSGSDRVFAQACRDLGLIRVHTLDEVLDVTRILAGRRRVRGRRLAIITASGGGGVLAADLAEDAGLAVPLLTDSLQAEVKSAIPGFGTAANPIDVTAKGAEDHPAFRQVLSAVTGSPEVDLVACVFSTHGPVAADVARSICDAYQRTDKPMVVVWGSPEPTSVQLLRSAGLPYFTNPRHALQALAAVNRPTDGSDGDSSRLESAWPPHHSLGCPVCSAGAGECLLLEAEAQAFLADYGIGSARSRSVTSAEQAAAAATELGFPLVMKLVAAAVPHREKAGGISLNVSSVASAIDQFDRLARIVPDTESEWSVLIQQQLPRGLEIVVGAQRDPDWGPTVLVGLGGTYTELIDRSVLRLAPVDSSSARSAIHEVFGNRLAGSGEDHLVQVIRQVSRAMLDHSRLDSIDINPLIVTPAGLVAVDGLLSLQSDQAHESRK